MKMRNRTNEWLTLILLSFLPATSTIIHLVLVVRSPSTPTQILRSPFLPSGFLQTKANLNDEKMLTKMRKNFEEAYTFEEVVLV